ncbi:MAG: hydroxyacylglutathione hydrolase [Steroidobacteraceae bacterium]
MVNDLSIESRRANATTTGQLQVTAVPAFADNYIWLIHSPRQPNRVVAVDPGEALPVQAALQRSQLVLAGIMMTHHHADHVGGVLALRTPELPVFGPASEATPGQPSRVSAGKRVQMAELGLEFEVLDIPGHTAGHIAYVGHGAVFCGDTLFSAGCGRLFEGTAEQMSHSLGQLAKLPSNTYVYCGHEYTLANLRFALAVEPDNQDALAHMKLAQSLRQQGLPTLPSTIELELKINPFLRLNKQTVKYAAAQHADRALNSESETFAALRDWKNHF